MRHLDLFSGIGGFSIAVDEVWPGSEHIFCDNDQYCQQLLKLRYPNSKIYGDIRTITNTNLWESRPRDESEPRETAHEEPCAKNTDILTGGFPCQPFSQAGKRKGTEDNRYLWPEMLRVIQLTKPTWVIAENVRGLLTIEGGLVFEQVCLDLEREGYEVQPFIIPAVAVNAPHRRDRVWIVANRSSERPDTGECDRQERQILSDEGITSQDKQERDRRKCGVGEISADASDTTSERLSLTAGQSIQGRSDRPSRKSARDNQREWEYNWLEVATEFCGVDDGLPAKLDRFELSKSRHRVERLKALGNAIVPQVAIEIMKAIKLYEIQN